MIESDFAEHAALKVDDGSRVWHHVVEEKKYSPQCILCHPEILLRIPIISMYYCRLCGLSQKAGEHYFAAIGKWGKRNPRAWIDYQKALKMAVTYNMFICSILNSSID